MLLSLHIRDFALIERLDVEFRTGLNIITGETGAGKSIIVGALKLLLGGRASADQIRAGARKAVLEATFDITDRATTRRLLRDNDLDELPELIIRREIVSGSSRAFVNDSPVLVTVLRGIAESLVDLHGQHDQQSLLRPEVHREVVDAFGGHEADAAAVSEAYGRWRGAVRQLRSIDEAAESMLQQAELYDFQKREIDEISPDADEEETLDQELSRLSNAARLSDESSQLYEALYGDDGSVYDSLSTAVHALEQLARLDESLSTSATDLRSALISVGEVAAGLREYGGAIEEDPARLAEVQERIGAFERLKRKYGGTIEAVLDYRARIDASPTREGLEGERKRAAASVRQAETELARAAGALSAARAATARELEPSVVAALARLGMERSSFEVVMRQKDATDGGVAPGGTFGNRRLAVSEAGVDEVEFYISPNAGEPVRPLAGSASGGEISRIMLALKSITAQSSSVPVLVFDEIDVGISGSVAQRVGEEMRALGEVRQVIAITHLPQIAAQGEAHYFVEKREADGRTRTEIRSLSEEERAAQIARLISGVRVTESAMTSARELIESAASDTGRG